jgi:hypothetical protein
MIASLGNEVVELRRLRIGGLELEGLPEGKWRFATPEDLAKVFGGPSSEQVMGQAAAQGSDGAASQAASSSSGAQSTVASSSAASSGAVTSSGAGVGRRRAADVSSTAEVGQAPLPGASSSSSRGAAEQHAEDDDEAEVHDIEDGSDEEEGEQVQQVSRLSTRVRDSMRWRRRRQQLQQSIDRSSARQG